MYKKNMHIHFVGIGGIGMSGIATILRHQGYTISGCDLDLDQQSIKDLRSLGCIIHEGNNGPYCNDESIEALVYSSAIHALSPEIIAAQNRGIPTLPRALMLAELMRTKYSIAIGGAHGKTTTTSLISHILMSAQFDPTIIIGGHLKNISSNAHFGHGDFLVAEADESDRSLVNLHATIAVITNIDLEHLETYKDIDDIKQTFRHFLNNVPFYGKAVLCIDDLHIQSLLPMPHLKIITYGSTQSADLYIDQIMLHPASSVFTVFKKNVAEPLGVIEHPMPGKHNALNALAAIAVSLDLGIPFSTIANALKQFKGIDRRFSACGTYKGAELFDDYGHHPKEIYHTLNVAKNRTKNKVTVIFQPHRYIRTQALWNQFVDTFVSSGIDHLIITDIYPAGETPITNITGKNLADAILDKNPPFSVSYAPYEDDFTQLHQQLDTLISENDLVLLLGAGKINKMAKTLS